MIFFSTSVFADNFAGGFMIGYNGGLGFEGALKIGQFAQGFPFHLRIGLGYTSVSNPGKAWDARRIFINDNANGDPEKSGHYWDFSFDLLYKVSLFNMKEGYVYFGPRYSSFTGNFNFVGGNEDFDVTSGQWGLGSGLIAYFPISAKMNFTAAGGLAYYFASTLTGHDTSYSPDGEHVNARNDYDYDDANDAINQPRLEFRAMIGLSFVLK